MGWDGAMMLRRASIGLSGIRGANSGVSLVMCVSLSGVLVWTAAIGPLSMITLPQRSTTRCIAMKEVTIARPARLLSEISALHLIIENIGHSGPGWGLAT